MVTLAELEKIDQEAQKLTLADFERINAQNTAPSGINQVQPRNAAQQQRLGQIQAQRERVEAGSRQAALERGLAPNRFAGQPGREEALLQQGIETEGPALRKARLLSGFTSNPIPVIRQGLQEEFPDATPEQLNVRYQPTVGNAELSKNLDEAFSVANNQAMSEIAKRKQEGEEISDDTVQKIYDKWINNAIGQTAGLELVYDNPMDGRTTAINPTGFDLGDLGELLGPSIPFAGETVGAGLGGAGGFLSPVPGGTIAGAGIGGAAGGGTGEAIRLGIGQALGVESNEQDFASPVFKQAGESGINSLLGGAISKLAVKSLAKQVANGNASLETAKLARYVDPEEFAKNKKAVERLNQLAEERGIQLSAKPTLGQLANNQQLLNAEKQLRTPESPLTELPADQGRFIDEIAGAFNPRTGDLKEGKTEDLINGIQRQLNRRIRAREDSLGRQLNESETAEEALQINTLLTDSAVTHGAFGPQALRDAAETAEKKIFREKFKKEFEGLEERAKDVSVDPAALSEEAFDLLSKREKELFKSLTPGDQKVLEDAALAEKINFIDFNRSISNLKAEKRRIDAGQVNDKNARIYARLIESAENSLDDALKAAGRDDILADLKTTRTNYGEAKQNFQQGFGKLMRKDSFGNYTVDDADVFEKIVMGAPGMAVGIKSTLVDAGLENQLPMIREGIKDLFAKKFLPEGAQPLTKGQIGAANKWFRDNENTLSQYFDTPELLNEFKSPVRFAREQQRDRERLRKANDKMRKWFGADLGSSEPSDFMDRVFSKQKPGYIKQLKKLLPEDNWQNFQDLYRQELLSQIRSDSLEPKFDLDKLMAKLGGAKSPSAREQIGSQTIKEVLGEKGVQDLHDYGEAVKILQRTGTRADALEAAPEDLKLVARFFVGPLTETSRRINVLLKKGQNGTQNRLERAMANPEDWDRMMRALRAIDNPNFNAGTATATTNVLRQILGDDLFNNLRDTEEEIKNG